MKTRRHRKLRGGNKEQIEHAISQLKRFTERAKEGQEFNALQFGYNLGRAQEMVDGSISKSHEIWWKPIEPLVLAKKWDDLSAKIDTLKTRAKVDYDEPTVNKGKV